MTSDLRRPWLREVAILAKATSSSAGHFPPFSVLDHPIEFPPTEITSSSFPCKTTSPGLSLRWISALLGCSHPAHLPPFPWFRAARQNRWTFNNALFIWSHIPLLGIYLTEIHTFSGMNVQRYSFELNKWKTLEQLIGEMMNYDTFIPWENKEVRRIRHIKTDRKGFCKVCKRKKKKVSCRTIFVRYPVGGCVWEEACI